MKKDHGQRVPDCSEIWFAVMEPDTKPMGKVKKDKQLWQQQDVETMAVLLGFEFKAKHEVTGKTAVVLQHP